MCFNLLTSFYSFFIDYIYCIGFCSFSACHEVKYNFFVREYVGEMGGGGCTK